MGCNLRPQSYLRQTTKELGAAADKEESDGVRRFGDDLGRLLVVA